MAAILQWILSNYEDIFSLVITSFVLIAWMFEQVVTM